MRHTGKDGRLDIEREVWEIERRLRARGVAAVDIPQILGAAFAMSLTNLDPVTRVAVIMAHRAALNATERGAMTTPQAPDGPLPPFDLVRR